MDNKCKKGYVLRKGYYRKSYVRKDGIKVKRSYVPPKCIKDQGKDLSKINQLNPKDSKPGKGPKILPEIKRLNLGQFGYELKYSFEQRKKALKKAIKKYDPLKILRYLVLIRTYSKSNKKNYDKYTKDIKFIQKLRSK